MNINRTPTVKTGMPSGGRSFFAKFAKVTSTPGNGYSEWRQLGFYFLSRRGVRLISFVGDLLNAEGRQNGFTVKEAEQPVCGLVIQLLSRIGVNVAHHTQNVALL